MRSFQAALAFLMAIMVNMALAAPGIYATAMILATTLVDTVLSSGFQHSVVAVPGRVHSRQAFASPFRTSHETGCFNTSTFNSTLVPWAALANENDPQSDLAVYYALTELCKKFSATIMTRNVPVSAPLVGPLDFIEAIVRVPNNHFAYHGNSTPTVSPTTTQTARTASSRR